MDSSVENSIGVLTTDSDLVIQFWDPALERMTGIPSERAIGRGIQEVIPDLAERSLLVRFERAVRQGTSEFLSPGFHRYLIPCPPLAPSKHFQEMRQQVNISALREGIGIRGLVVTIEDVTSRMEGEIELANDLRSSEESVRLSAARSIADGTGAFAVELADPIIEALSDSDWRVRRRLVDGLARRAAPDAIAALLAAMKDRHLDFGIVNSALDVLRSTSIETTQTLVEFLHAEEPDLRMHAALALGEHGDPSVTAALMRTLDDPDINVRYHAIEALGKLKAVESVGILLSIADSGDFFLSFAALEALGSIAHGPTAERLVTFLDDERLWEPAVRALAAIGAAKHVGTIASLVNSNRESVLVIAEMLASLYDGRSDSNDAAASIKEQISPSIRPQGIANIVAVLESAGESDLPGLMKLAGFIDDDRVRELLSRYFDDPELRIAASDALEMHGASAVSLLLSKIESDDVSVRETAIAILGRIRAPGAVGPLVELAAGDPETAPAVADALGQIGGAAASEALTEFIKAGDIPTRLAAVRAVARLGDPSAVAQLTGLISDPDPEIRKAAIDALGILHPSEAFEPVLARLKDSDERVRQAVLKSLPAIGGLKAVEGITGSLTNDTSAVRAAAAQALAELDCDAARQALAGALSDADSWTRYFALRGLGRLRGLAFSEQIATIAKDDEAEHVRVAAAEVLEELRA